MEKSLLYSLWETISQGTTTFQHFLNTQRLLHKNDSSSPSSARIISKSMVLSEKSILPPNKKVFPSTRFKRQLSVNPDPAKGFQFDSTPLEYDFNAEFTLNPNITADPDAQFSACKVPEYKMIHGTNYSVDGFQYKASFIKGYFLSHMHSDHYTGLNSSWKHGPIFCSVITARLCHHVLQVDKKWIFPLPDNISVRLTKHLTVTLFDANHLSGSSLFLFQLTKKDGTIEKILHTGDFRFHPSMCFHPLMIARCLDSTVNMSLNSFHKHIKSRTVSPTLYRPSLIDTVYLDNTFLDSPSHRHPFQYLAIQSIIHTIQSNWYKSDPENKKQTLFVIGSYSMGKERILLSIAQHLGVKIYVEPERFEKMRLMNLQQLTKTKPWETWDGKFPQMYMQQLDRIPPEKYCTRWDIESDWIPNDTAWFNAHFTKNPQESRIHCFSMGFVSKVENLQVLLGDKYDKIVAFRPTGWNSSQSSWDYHYPVKSLVHNTTPPGKMIRLPSAISKPLVKSQLKMYNNKLFHPPPNCSLHLKPRYLDENRQIYLYSVPYSEHSSYAELHTFIQYLFPSKVIPTVFSSKSSVECHEEFAKNLNDWGKKSSLLSYFVVEVEKPFASPPKKRKRDNFV